MSNHYLLVDDARRTYFDCEKMLIVETKEKSFDTWLLAIDGGNELPIISNRYQLALAEATSLYGFLVASKWNVRTVTLDDDDWDEIYGDEAFGRRGWTCSGTIWPLSVLNDIEREQHRAVERALFVRINQMRDEAARLGADWSAQQSVGMLSIATVLGMTDPSWTDVLKEVQRLKLIVDGST